MVGVVGLGILAVTLLASGKPEGAFPGAPPGVPPSPGQRLIMLGDPLKFENGRYYRARIKLTSKPLTAMGPLGQNISISSASTKEDLGRGLVALGFQDVRVYMNERELPADWPKETAQAATPETRWFSGAWGGPTMSVPRPPAIEAVWTV